MTDNTRLRGAVFRLENARQSLASDLTWSDAAATSPCGDYLWPAAPNRSNRDAPPLPRIVRSIDSATVILATILTGKLEAPMLTHPQAVANAVAGLVTVLVFVIASRKPRLEHAPSLESFIDQLRFLAPAVIVAGIAQAGMFWVLGAGNLGLLGVTWVWMLAAACGLTIVRSGTLLALRHPLIARRLTRKIAIIGHDESAFRVAERLRAETRSNVDVVGIFCDGPAPLRAEFVNGTIADLINLSRETELYGIIIALPPAIGTENPLLKLSLKLRGVLADVFIMPYLVLGHDDALPTQSIGRTSFAVLQRRPLDGWQMAYKRALDVVISSLALVMFFAPLFVVVATLIKLDSPGPVFFRQPRRGFNNRPFMVYKFRTMYTDKTDLHAAKQTSRGDPRVTRIGKWLRRLSIDELPQLLNVLRDDMSLVGPRPHALHTRVEGELLNDALSEYLIRYQVKPGITGWAQINGARGELITRDDLRRRVTYDLEYIQRWSIRFDLKIIFMTAAKEIFSKYAF